MEHAKLGMQNAVMYFMTDSGRVTEGRQARSLNRIGNSNKPSTRATNGPILGRQKNI
jgi:hypothetical protein